jgi:hypothetical protein
MGDALEGLSLGGVRENDRSERCPVEVPVRGEDLRSERVDDGGEALGPSFDDIASELVGVDDRNAAFREATANGAFSRSDSAGESKDMHAPEGARCA